MVRVGFESYSRSATAVNRRARRRSKRREVRITSRRSEDPRSFFRLNRTWAKNQYFRALARIAQGQEQDHGKIPGSQRSPRRHRRRRACVENTTGQMTSPSNRSLRGAIIISFCIALAFSTITARLRAAQPARDYPIRPVPFTAVHCDDIFWAPRIETNRLVTIPFAFQQCEKSGRMSNFDRAAKALRGQELTDRKPPPYPFDDTD